MTSLSIVIPAIGTQTEVDQTLLSVLENRPHDCEILLVHPEEYVDPYDLADEVQLHASSHQEMIPLFNEGLGKAQGEFIHLLRPGVQVEHGWCDAVLDLFADDGSLGAVTPSVYWKRSVIRGVSFDARRGKKIMYRRLPKSTAPLLGIGFFQTAALRFMQGYDQSYGELADVELGIRMRSGGYQCRNCADSELVLQHQPSDGLQLGFAGGKRRARLLQAARQHGFASGMQRWTGLLGESLNHGLVRPSMIAAMAGHLSAWLSKQPAPVITSVESVRSQRQRRAA